MSDIQWETFDEKQRWEMFLKVFRENAAFNESIEKMSVETYVAQNNQLPHGYANILHALKHNKKWVNERVWATDGYNTYEHNTPWEIAVGCMSSHFLDFIYNECGFEWMKDSKVIHWVFCLQMYQEIFANGFLQYVLSMMFFGRANPDVFDQMEILCAHENKGRIHYIINTLGEIKSRTGSNMYAKYIQPKIDLLTTLIINKREHEKITSALNDMNDLWQEKDKGKEKRKM